MVLVGVSMKENAMGGNISSRHTPLVLVVKCLTIRFQDHMPIIVVRKGYGSEMTNLSDVRNASTVLVSSSHTRCSASRRSCCIIRHSLLPHQNIQRLCREVPSHWSSSPRPNIHALSSGPQLWRRSVVDRSVWYAARGCAKWCDSRSRYRWDSNTPTTCSWG
jgi:hypothetical protein